MDLNTSQTIGNSETRMGLWAPRFDLLVLTALVVLCIGVFMGSLGVWEPWEVDTVIIAEQMQETGRWLEVVTSASDTKSVAVNELPFGWWPVAASTYIFGSNSLGIRLPYFALALLCLLGLFIISRNAFGRRTAWFSALITLSMPLFVFHTRFALGSGITMLFATLGALGFMGILARMNTGWSCTVAGIGTVGAGLAGGLPGLMIPLSLAIVALFMDRLSNETCRKFVAITVSISGLIVLLGWWRAWVYAPPSATLESMFLWADPVGGLDGTSKRPAFNMFVHQLGVGLFPLGVLLPLAFTDVLSPHERRAMDESRASSDNRFVLGIALTAWFVTSFLGPALGASYSHYAIFLGAPAAALVLAIYLDRMLQDPPRPLFALLSVLFIALVDSSLKHNPQMLADTLISGTVDAFPSKLNSLPFARYLNFALLGLILLYQGGVHRWLRQCVAGFAYPNQARRIVDPILLGATATVPLVLWMKTTHLNGIIRYAFWNPLKPFMRRLIVGIFFWIVAYFLIRFLWNLRVRLLAGRTTGKLHRAVVRGSEILDSQNVSKNLVEQVTSVFFPAKSQFWNPNRAVMALLFGGLFPVGASIFAPAFRTLQDRLPQFLSFIGPRAIPREVLPISSPSAWLVGLSIALLIFGFWSAYIVARSQGVGDGLASRCLALVRWKGNVLQKLGIANVLFMTVLCLWIIFFNAPIATALTTNFSQKEIIDAYHRYAQGVEPVFRYRVKDENRSFYSRKLVQLTAQEFRKRARSKDRFFAIVPQKQLASINREFRQAIEPKTVLTKADSSTQTANNVAVLYNGGSRFLLISNTKRDEERDLNPISRASIKSLPKYAHKLSVNFEDKIELVGWRIAPDTPRPGGALNLHLFWKLSKKFKASQRMANWKIFVHIDAPGQRIHGDHYPVEGLHPTQNWRHEDHIIHDVHRINVKRTISPATFTVYTGMYVGKKRLKITKGPRDRENRARLGSIRVR